MLLKYKNLTIRNAGEEDAKLLAAWWNDGRVMAHAGFPNGLNKTPESVVEGLLTDADDVKRTLMIELDGTPIGEMNYLNKGERIVDIGIKICDFARQEKGYGRILLSMLIQELFQSQGYEKIVLSTNLNNKRAQHVYRKLGFVQTGIYPDSWKNQEGELQSTVEFELVERDFVNFTGEH